MLLGLCPTSVYRSDAIWHSSSYNMLNMENINIQTSYNHHTHHIAIKYIKHIKYVIYQTIYITHIIKHHNSSITTHTSSYTSIRHHTIQVIHHHSSYIINIKCIKHIKYVIYQTIYIMHIIKHHNSSSTTHTSSYTSTQHHILVYDII